LVVTLTPSDQTTSTIDPEFNSIDVKLTAAMLKFARTNQFRASTEQIFAPGSWNQLRRTKLQHLSSKLQRRRATIN